MAELLLGIDMGTTWCKAAVVTPDGGELAHHRVPLPWQAVPTGAEIEPRRLLQVALAAAGGSLDRAPAGRVVGVGVTSMAEAGALLDAADRPVAPERPRVEEAAARGAALFPGSAARIFGGIDELPAPEPTRIEAVT
jgi:sugar (pentulose or hexulose) kinase